MHPNASRGNEKKHAASRASNARASLLVVAICRDGLGVAVSLGSSIGRFDRLVGHIGSGLLDAVQCIVGIGLLVFGVTLLLLLLSILILLNSVGLLPFGRWGLTWSAEKESTS